MKNQRKQSTFITVMAWISIIFSGFGVFVGIMQNIMMQTVMKDAHFEEAISKQEGIPPMMEVMFENFELLVMGTLIVTILTFIASIGLLKRKNWARIFFIVLMVGGIIWTLLGLTQFFFTDSMVTQGIPQDIPPEFQNMQNTMKIVMGTMSVLMVAFYLYLIKRLNSDEIKEEFLER